MRLIDPVIPLLILTAMAAGFIAYRNTVQDSADGQNAVAENSTSDSDTNSSIPDTGMPLVEIDDTDTTVAVTDADGLSETSLPSSESGVSDSIPVIVRITGLKPQSANVLIAIFDSAEAFPKPELRKHTEVVAATETTLEHTLMLEQNKPLAIAVIQDLDGNRGLTRNIFGIPTEPYGFSNNARGLTGPPDFQKVMFSVHQNSGPIEIEVR